ncbi:hypothetical protein AAC387_Pa06g2185 [Persea americana]
MDTSWMKIEDRQHPQYIDGVKPFWQFVYAHIDPGKKIWCPCVKCNNIYFRTRDDVEVDLYYHGIVKCYIPWVLHGEEFEASIDEDDDEEPSKEDEDDHDDMQEMLHDHYITTTINAWTGEDSSSYENAVPDWKVDKFMRLLKDAEQKLYPGCEKFYNEHKEQMERESLRNVVRRHEEKFPKWFEERLYNQGNARVNKQLLDLALGFDRRVIRYKDHVINGLRFHTKDWEMFRKTQNSSVVVMGDNETGNQDYYGVLTYVIQLDYFGDNNVFLFNCDWWDVGKEGRGIQTNKHNYTGVNFTKKWNINEPFVLTSQALQVFNVKDSKLGNNWQVVRDNIPPILIDANLVVHEEVEDEDVDTFINDESREDDTSIDYDNEEDEMSTDNHSETNSFIRQQLSSSSSLFVSPPSPPQATGFSWMVADLYCICIGVLESIGIM